MPEPKGILDVLGCGGEVVPLGSSGSMFICDCRTNMP